MRSTYMYCSYHCISVSSDLAICYAPQCLAIPPHVENSYITRAVGWTIQGSNAIRGIFCFPKRPDKIWGLPSFIFNTYRGSSWGIKRWGREADNSVPSSTDAKNEWSYNPFPLYAFMACAGETTHFNLYFLNCNRTVAASVV